MHRIDGPGATTDNRFTAGNPATGVQATMVTADWCNHVQEEICTVIERAGLTLNKAQTDQLWRAIQQLVEDAAGGGGGGGVTGGQNLGGGVEILKALVNGVLQFRTIVAGSNVNVALDGDRIVLSATATGGGGGATWGSIGGTLGNQIDLASALNAKANLSGATFTGAVNAPSFNTTSALRYKKQIEALDETEAAAIVQSIGVVRYALRSDGSRRIGVIAEQVMDGPAEFVVQRNPDGEAEAVDYQSLFAASLRVVQSLAERVQALEQRLGGA